MTVPLDHGVNLAEVAGLPWCSIATLHSDGEKLHRVVCPAMPQKDGWALPVLLFFSDPATGVSEYQREAERMRKECGLEPASA
jgi:hypothetical protein